MPSPLRKTWQESKKALKQDKLFNKDLGPNLDKAQDAYDALVAENNKKITLEGFDHPTPDLVKVREKIAKAVTLHEKVHTVATGYKSVLDKMDKHAPGVTKGLSTINDIIVHFQKQDTQMRQHIPSEEAAKKFKQAYMKSTLKQF